MILNAYSVLDAFVTVLRVLAAVLVLGIALHVLATRRRSPFAFVLGTIEDRYYLLFLLAILLLALNVASWPLFYLVLQSYVSEWNGVMCIYGVTRIGAGSMGPSRFLPDLLAGLQLLKPALVFVSGAWFVLYWINRQTATGALLPRVLGVLVLLGVAALADGLAELAYLFIPKKEEFLSAGCCAEAFSSSTDAGRFLPHALLASDQLGWLEAAYWAVNAGMVLALGLARRRVAIPTKAALTAIGIGALASMAVSALFLVEIAAPRLLRLPYHHCPYDLLPRVPESVVMMGLFAAGFFAVGWAWVAGCWAEDGEGGSRQAKVIQPLLDLAWIGYLGAAVMMGVALALVSS